MMFHKSLPYITLFRIAGILFLLFGLSHAYTVASLLPGSGENIPGTIIAVLGPLVANSPMARPSFTLPSACSASASALQKQKSPTGACNLPSGSPASTSGTSNSVSKRYYMAETRSYSPSINLSSAIC